MPITPPKCKTCGEIEWNHVCNKQLVKKRLAVIEQRQRAKPKRNQQRQEKSK